MLLCLLPGLNGDEIPDEDGSYPDGAEHGF